jgi:hypothetical protein
MGRNGEEEGTGREEETWGAKRLVVSFDASWKLFVPHRL